MCGLRAKAGGIFRHINFSPQCCGGRRAAFSIPATLRTDTNLASASRPPPALLYNAPAGTCIAACVYRAGHALNKRCHTTTGGRSCIHLGSNITKSPKGAALYINWKHLYSRNLGNAGAFLSRAAPYTCTGSSRRPQQPRCSCRRQRCAGISSGEPGERAGIGILGSFSLRTTSPHSGHLQARYTAPSPVTLTRRRVAKRGWRIAARKAVNSGRAATIVVSGNHHRRRPLYSGRRRGGKRVASVAATPLGEERPHISSLLPLTLYRLRRR